MARKKPTRRTKSSRGAGRASASEHKLPALVGAIIVVVCVTVAGIVFGLHKLWHVVTQMQEFRVRPIEAPLKSDWIDGERLRTELQTKNPDLQGKAAEQQERDAKLLKGSWSIFEPGLSRRVAAAYSRSPWVRRVHAVNRIFPNRLDIQLDLREPCAVIRCVRDGRYYCVDEGGVILSPTVYKLSREHLSHLLPAVVAHQTRTVPRRGERWKEMTVQGGIKMLRLCREQFLDKAAIKEIEVRKVTLGNDITYANAWLILATGTRIHWGRTPGAVDSPAESSTPQKTANFLAMIRKEGANLGRRRRVDLRGKTPIIE